MIATNPTTKARRICRSLNRHTRMPATRAATGGSIHVYFDEAGHEVYATEAGARSRHGPFEDVCPRNYQAVFTARHHQPWTIAAVQDSLEWDAR